MDENAVSREVVDSALKVHSALGCGLLESVYETCLADELTRRGMAVRKQVALPVRYEDAVLETGYRLDLLSAFLCVLCVLCVDAVEDHSGTSQSTFDLPPPSGDSA